MSARRWRWVHVMFVVGVVGKGVDGVLEVVGGALLAFATSAQIQRVVHVLTGPELSEDPTDLLSHALRRAAAHIDVDMRTFGAIYLVSHGVIKIGLVAALLKKRRWAYPGAMAAFGLFVAYQLYRWSLTHGAWLLVLSALDLVVIALTWLEYRRLRDT